jgi:hypothetical protein
LANDRLATVKDEAGASQGLILDHPNGQRLTMTGSAVTSAGLNSPLGWVKNLGPGTIYMRGDGTAAGINQAGSYPLYAGQDWPLAADNGSRTISPAGPSGTIVSVIPAKATSAAVVGGGGGAGFTDADVDLTVPIPSTPAARPDVGRLNPLLKKIRAALDAGFGTLPWGGITGSIAAQADLVAALATKSDVGHTHAIGAIGGAGTAASRNVPAAGAAASNEVVLGNDPRMTDARTPLAHSQAISTITSLQTALDNLRVGAGSFTYIIDAPTVGTYVVEEYAEAAGTLTHDTDRLTSGTCSYRVQIGGSDVPGLGTSASPLGPTTTQTRRAVTAGGQAFAVGARTQVVVSAVGTPGQLILHFRRNLT